MSTESKPQPTPAKGGNQARGGKGSTPSGASQKKKKNSAAKSSGATDAVTNDIASIMVLCGDAPASGLFVIFKVLPREEDTVYADVFKAMQKGFLPDEEQEHKPSPLMAENERYLYGFSLAFVDGEGFLQPVVDGANPWKEISPQLKARWAREAQWRKKNRKKEGRPPLATRSDNPHSIVIPEGTRCQLALLRHPSPDLARALTTYLNTGRDPDGYGFEKWKAEGPLVRELPIEVDSNGGKQLLLKVPETPDAYVPTGAAEYGRWVLYCDMPHAELDSVRKAVHKYQLDLGTLRYPVGGGRPYFPESNAGVFDIKAMASTHAFQLHAAEGRAFKVVDKLVPHAHGKARQPPAEASRPNRAQHKASWAYLIGQPIEFKPDLDKSRIEPGVVDVATAKAVQRWMKEGLRKAGDILIETATGEPGGAGPCWNEWGRPEMVTSIELWRELSRALGCSYGIQFGHTFRNLEDGAAEEGKALCSIHKTGMAVDLAVKGAAIASDDLQDYSLPAAYWPIRYEANWRLSPAKALDQAEKAHRSAVRGRETAQKKLDAARARAQTALETAQARLTQTEARLQSAREAAETAAAAAAVPVVGKRNARPSVKSGRKGLDPVQQATRDVTRCETELQKKTAARQTLESPDHPLQKDLAAKQQTEATKKEEMDKIMANSTPTKAAYHINWRLYGHSTWDVFSLKPQEVQQQLAQRLGQPPPDAGPNTPWKIEKDYGEALLGCFTDREAARPWLKAHLERCRKVASQLVAMDGNAVVERFFREHVDQWNYNPYEADGGTSGERIWPAEEQARSFDYLDASLDSKAKGIQANIKSFLNITALAFECNLLRIGAMRAGWRDPKTDPNAKKPKAPVRTFVADRQRFGPVAGLLDRMRRPNSAHLEDVITLQGNGREVVRLVTELDVDFIKDWAKKLATLSGALSAGAITEFTITLDGAEAAKEQALGLLNEFGSKRFQLMRFGTLVKLAEVPDIATGSKWAELVSNAFDQFKLLIEKKPEDAGAADSPPPTGKKGVFKAQEKKAKAKAKPSTPKSRLDWILTLQPVFDLAEAPPGEGASAYPFTLYAGDVISLPTPGNGRTMEWWHYETFHANNQAWGDLLEQIGYSLEVIGAPVVPAAKDSAYSINGRGGGYSAGDLADIKGGALRGAPENKSDQVLDGG